MSLRDSLVTDLSSKLQQATQTLETQADPVRWIERDFYIPETKNDPILRGRLQLMPYHRDVLHEALSTDKNGNYKYSIIIWSDIKKSIKSTIAAAVNQARATTTDWGEYYVIANDLKQADSRVARYIRRSILLNPKTNPKRNKEYKINGYRIEMPSGSFIEAIPIDPSGEAGSNADQLTWCLDEQTEILTRDGWRGWETLSMDDEIATRSIEGCFQWQSPQDIYCQEYSGPMYKITSRSLDMLVTPDHRMFGRFIGGRGIAPGVQNAESREFVAKLEDGFLKASDAAKTRGFFPVLTSAWLDGEEKEFLIPATFNQVGKGNGRKWIERQHAKKISAELYAEFMGWYLSEGCVIKKRGGIEGFSIGQSRQKNPEKYKRIVEILKAMSFVPHFWNDGMNIVVYHSTFAKQLAVYGLSDEKYIPDEIKNLPKKCLKIFLDAYKAGDGCQHGIYGYTIGSKSKEMRDDLIEVAQKCGYSVSSYERQDFRWKKEPMLYYVYIRAEKTSKRQKVEQKHWSIVDYKGIVFCPSTQNGVIYVRRNGRYCWTGNSELWGSNEKAKQNMWSEMTISPVKQGKSFRWVESYAGFAEESELLYSLYDLGVKRGEQLWPDKLYDVTDGVPTPLELYVNQEARMLCLWNTQPRCPWQTKEYYAAEAAVLPPNQFQRMHRNQWVSSTETFVPMAWFDACGHSDAEWPELDKQHTSFIITLDAAVSGAALGLWMGCRHPKYPQDVLEVYAQKWEPTGADHKIDFYGTDEKPGLDKVLRRLLSEYNVVEVGYDEFQLHSFCSKLYQEGLAWFRPFPQGNERLIGDSLFRDMIRERRYWHRRNPDMREHVQNADAKIDPEDRKIRIVKRADRLNVDLAVCAAMGCRELTRLNL